MAGGYQFDDVLRTVYFAVTTKQGHQEVVRNEVERTCGYLHVPAVQFKTNLRHCK
jgi:hypothetical protein